MRGALVELLRRQHRGEDRHFGAQLHVHQRLDHGVGDEFMAVDAAIDHEPRRHDRGIAPRLGEDLRMQRYLERAGHLEHIDIGNVTRLDLAEEGDAAFLDHLAVPGGLHERDPLRFCKSRVRKNGRMIDRLGRALTAWRLLLRKYLGVSSDLGSILQHLIHGFPLSGPEPGHTERRAARNAAVATVLFHPDFNRRLRNHTDLLTLFPVGLPREEGARGLGLLRLYRRWGLTPRPENIGARYGQPDGKYDQWPGRQQAPSHRKSACPHAARARLRAGRRGIRARN